MKVVNKAYKYRFYPTPEQAQQLAHSFGCVRFIYNYFLKLRSETYNEKKEKINYSQMCALLTDLKKQEGYEWLTQVSIVILQQSARNLERAFVNFFLQIAAYPNYKKKHAKQSVRYTKSGYTYKDGNLKLAKHKEPLDIRWSQPFQGDPTSVTVSKDQAGRYFVSFAMEESIVELPRISKKVGIDVGIKDVCATSDGMKSGSPQYLRKYETKLAKLQREFSRKVKGSKNREKARLKVAKTHVKISDSRNDFNHKLTTTLISENQAIVVESLNVKGMMKNHCLAKSIADSGWGDFFSKLSYKAEWYGRELIIVDRWLPSSKTCSHCNYVNSELTLDAREWKCPECRSVLDRDINAAQNILTAGLAGIAFGESGRLGIDSSIVSSSL